MHSITDTTAAFATLAMCMWCTSAIIAMRTIRTIATTAINRANPCDLAAVLGALPGMTNEISRLRVIARGLA
ncbi:hypothetical protein ACFXPA_23915 [Amycolatopsis sp. NPDC059090]|uniref:hypothetical protein n=1 Tax=unclassified Amycolatopsis TaxID=2618356 RepID=UPI003672C1EB